VDRILAIAGLRMTLLARKSRGTAGVVRVLVAALTYLLGSIVAFGLGIGLGVMTWLAARDGDPRSVRVAFLVAFYTASFFALVMPVFTGAMNPGFDVSPLRVFPISKRRLYAITLGAGALNTEHLLYYPSIAAVFLAGIVLPGADAALGFAIVAAFLLFLVGWGNTIALALMGLMRSRRSREIVGITVLGLLIAVSVIPALLQDDSGKIDVEAYPWIESVIRGIAGVGQALPPTLAADAIASLHGPSKAGALPPLLWLVLWDVVGLLIGYRVFTHHVIGDGGGKRKAREATSPAVIASEERAWRRSLTSDHAALSFIPGEVRAVAAKELRYLLRSAVGKFNLVMMPVFAVIVVFLFGRNLDNTFLGLVPDDMLLFGMLLYATLFSNNFVNNAFAWERDGMQAYFLLPVPPRWILAGKNLGVWIYNGMLLTMTLLTWSVLKGIPSPATLLAAITFYASCVLAFTTAGNVVSVLFPAGRDISALKNTPSQVAILLSLVFILVIGAVAGLFLVLPWMVGMPGLRPVSLLVLLAALVAVYTGTLRLAGRLLSNQREKLIETLRAAD
jgi:hypothetical protein